MGVDYLLEFTIHISISQVTQTHTQTNKHIRHFLDLQDMSFSFHS